MNENLESSIGIRKYENAKGVLLADVVEAYLTENTEQFDLAAEQYDEIKPIKYELQPDILIFSYLLRAEESILHSSRSTVIPYKRDIPRSK